MKTALLDTLVSSLQLMSRQRARVALVALQIVAMGNQFLSEDGLHLLRNLAESEDELAMDADALARTIIVREMARMARPSALEF